MDDTNQKSLYDTLVDLIQNALDISEDQKKKYTVLLDTFKAGKIADVDVDTAHELDDYLEALFIQLEDEAMLARDTEQINLLADLRNQRTELQKQLLGINTASTPASVQ